MIEKQSLEKIKKLKQLKPDQISDVEYDKLFPETIAYIKNNIFHLANNKWVIKSLNKDGAIYFKEIDKIDLRETYLTYSVKRNDYVDHWFSNIFSKLYEIDCDPCKPFIYGRRENILNLFQGLEYRLIEENKDQEQATNEKD